MSSAMLPRSVLFIAGRPLDSACVRYRCYHLQEQLALAGIPSEVRWVGEPHVSLDHDLIVLHRLMHEEYVAEIIDRARTLGKVLVFETDDLVFESDFARYQGYKTKSTTTAAADVQAWIDAHLHSLRACDACLASTEFIATMERRHGKQAFVVRNAFSREELDIAQSVYRHPVADGGRIVLGYMSGTASHNWDFAETSTAILEVMHKHPQVYLQVTGPLDLPDEYREFGHRVRKIPLVPWQHIYQILASVDINLAPLEIREPFCQGKSEIKYVEAALVGVPTIASATEVFQHAIVHGETSLLAHNHVDWVAALESLITNPADISRLGDNARQHVLREYSPGTRSRELVGALRSLMESVAKAKGMPPNPQTNANTSTIVYRPDFGFPFASRPPLFPPQRKAILFLVTLTRRILRYEGYRGLIRRMVLSPIRWLVGKLRTLKTLK